MLEQLICRIENNKITRRDLLKTSILATASLPVFYLSSDAAITGSKVGYLEVKLNSEKRQKYLNQLFEDKMDLFNYAGKLTYEKNPLEFGIKKMLEHKLGNSDSAIIIIDKERLKMSYVYVVMKPSNFGKRMKSEVYAFPLAFEKLSEEELKITLYHENVHCKDSFEGLKLKNELFQTSKLDTGVLEEILELRATYEELEYIWRIGMPHGKDFLKKVSIEFIGDRERSYSASYFILKGMLEQGALSDYEANSVKKHLLSLDKWIEPVLKYRGM